MNTNVWIIIQDNSTPEHGSHNRYFYFARYLSEKGYKPVVYVASKARCSEEQMIQGQEKYLIDNSNGYPFVYIRTSNYANSMIRRLKAVAEFHHRLERLSDVFQNKFGEPDVIIGSTAYPLSPLLARKLSRRYGCKYVCEVRDLWPATLEEYGYIRKNGLIAKCFYRLEKSLYSTADEIIFTMEGGSEYIFEKGWDVAHGGTIDLSHVHYLNNGVDIKSYLEDSSNREYQIASKGDEFRVGYMGSIRKANNVGIILDAAKLLCDEQVYFYLFGSGVERDELEKRCHDEGIANVRFMGKINKHLVPSASKQMSMMIMTYADSQRGLALYGMSQNKLFDYFASGKPVLSNINTGKYSIINNRDCGYEGSIGFGKDLAERILLMKNDVDAMRRWSENSLKVANEYSYEVMTEKLIEIIEA